MRRWSFLRQLRREVIRMELFTSLVSSLGKREDGQTMASEVVAMALIVFAIWGVFSLLGHLG